MPSKGKAPQSGFPPSGRLPVSFKQRTSRLVKIVVDQSKMASYFLQDKLVVNQSKMASYFLQDKI